MWIDLLLIYLLVELTEATSDGERRLNTKLINFLKSSLYIEKRFRRDLLLKVNGKGNIIFEDNCHPSIPLVSCEKNYCDFASCPNFPNAECHLNLCGKCEPVYYFEGNKVDCYDFQTISPPQINLKTNEIKFDDNCPSDVPLVTCSSNPCEAHKCDSYPNAECHVNLCGTCEANFYVNGQQVLCNTTQTNDQLSQCFKERQRIIENKNLNKFVVDCDQNGAYKPLQCWPFVGLCWCVSENGEEMFGTRSYFPNKPKCEILIEDCRSKEYGCCPDNKTAAQGFHHQGCSNVIKSCQVSLYGCCDDQITFAKGPNQKGCSRLVSKCEHLRSITQQIFSFQPQCDNQGHFNPIQCWDTLDQCWCVNKDGIELKGTRLKGKQPDCSAVACEDKSNDCYRFAIVPGFCFRLKRYMTEYCRKSCGFCKEVSVVKPEPVRRGCSSPFGCCSDYISPAKGPDDYMCPLYSSVCSMPKVVGECYGYFPRYFYNQETNTCELFVYGGCRDNGNNFVDINECEEKCLEEMTPTKVSTTQLAELGIDMNVKETNKNDFNVLAGPLIECANKFGCCEDGITPALGYNFQGCPRYISFCEMPPASGSCADNIIKYFYNPEKMLCEDFFYGGCGGNANNFESVELCMNECNNKMIELKKQNVALNNYQIAPTIQTTNDQTDKVIELSMSSTDKVNSMKDSTDTVTGSSSSPPDGLTADNVLSSTNEPLANAEEIAFSILSKGYDSTEKVTELPLSDKVNYVKDSTESSSLLRNDLTANDVLFSTIEPIATTEKVAFSVSSKGFDSTNRVIKLSLTDEVNSIKDTTEILTESSSLMLNDLTANDVLSSTIKPQSTKEEIALSVSSKDFDSTDKVIELSLTDEVNSIKDTTEIVTESSSSMPNDLTVNDVLSSTIKPLTTTEEVAFSVSSKGFDSTNGVIELSLNDEVNSIKDSTEIVTKSSSLMPNDLNTNDVLSSTIKPLTTTEEIDFSVLTKGYDSTNGLIELSMSSTDKINSMKDSTDIVTGSSSSPPDGLTADNVLSSTNEPLANTEEVAFSVLSKGYNSIDVTELPLSDKVNYVKGSTESSSLLPNDLTANEVLFSTIEPIATTKKVAFSVSSKGFDSTNGLIELSLTDEVNSIKDSTEIVTESSSLMPKDLTANDVLSSTIKPPATTEEIAFSVLSKDFDSTEKVIELSLTDEVKSIKDTTEIITESSSSPPNDLTANDVLSSTIKPLTTTEDVDFSVSSKGFDSTNGLIELSSTDKVNSIKDSTEIVTESISLMPNDLTANDVLSSTIKPQSTKEEIAFSVLSKDFDSTEKVIELSLTDEVNSIKDTTEIVTESSSSMPNDLTVNDVLSSTIKPLTTTEEVAFSVSSKSFDSTNGLIELSSTDKVNSIKDSTEIVTESSSLMPNDLTANDVLSSTIKPPATTEEIAFSVLSKDFDSTEKVIELSLTDEVNSIKGSTEIVTESSSLMSNDLTANDVLSSTTKPPETTKEMTFSVSSKDFDSTEKVIELSLTDEVNSIKDTTEIVRESSSSPPNDLTANDVLSSTIKPLTTTEEVDFSVSSKGFDSTNGLIELSSTDEVNSIKDSTEIVTESSSLMPNDMTANDVLSSTIKPQSTKEEIAFSVSSKDFDSTEKVIELSLTDEVNSIKDTTEIVTESSSSPPNDLTANDVLFSTIKPLTTTEEVDFSVSSKSFDSTNGLIELSLTDEVNSIKDSTEIVTESSSLMPNDLTANDVLSSTIKPQSTKEEIAFSVSSKDFDSTEKVIELSLTDEVNSIKDTTEIVTESSSSPPNDLTANDVLFSTIKPLTTTEEVNFSVSSKSFDSTNELIELSLTDEVNSIKDSTEIVTESSSLMPNDMTANDVLSSTVKSPATTEEIDFSVSSKDFDSTEKVIELSLTDEVNSIKDTTEIVTESSSSMPNDLTANDVFSSTIKPLTITEEVVFSVSSKGYDSTNGVIELSMSSTDEVNSMKDSIDTVTGSNSSPPDDLTADNVLSSTNEPLANTEEVVFSVLSKGYDSTDKVTELPLTDKVNYVKDSTEIVTESSSLMPNDLTANDVLSSTIKPLTTTEEVDFSVSSKGFDSTNGVIELSLTDKVNSIKDSTEIFAESSFSMPSYLTANDVLSSTTKPPETTEEIAFSVSSKDFDSITVEPLSTTEKVLFSILSKSYDSTDKMTELSLTDEVDSIKDTTEIVTESSSLMPNDLTTDYVLSSTIKPLTTTEEVAFSVSPKGYESTNGLIELSLTDKVYFIKKSTEIVTKSSFSMPNDLTANNVLSSAIEPPASTEEMVFSEISGSVIANNELSMPSTDDVSTTEDSLVSLFKKSSSSLNKLNSSLSSSHVAATSTTVSTLLSKSLFGGIIKSDKDKDNDDGFLSGSEISEIHNDILNTYNLTSSLQHSESTTMVKSDNFKSNVEDIIQPTTPSSLDSSISLSHVCKLPFNKGNCRLIHSPRYYYNSSLNQCLLFVYGGCGGNGNNFNTENECNMKCSNKSLIRENDLNTNKKCGSLYGCCLDNLNGARGPNFLGCPKYNSSCDYPPAYGPCKASLVRWFYNGRKKECNTFSWGGCEGNENNFETEVDCLLQCGDDKQEYTDIFDESLETVLYPGCESDYGCCSDGLNKAKGPNQEGCPVYASECDMPNVPGNGNERLIRYIYDGLKRKCNAFIYSGKGGNLNNFASIAECEKKCEKSCEDSLPSYCAEWKNLNFCTDRPTIMNEYCKKTCNMCT
nr:serine-rich adhesin for platelets isoform X2 [Hydra vulgaris]